ncbi:hypothetical protein CHE218_10160 [Microbacterium sp. che218]
MPPTPWATAIQARTTTAGFSGSSTYRFGAGAERFGAGAAALARGDPFAGARPPDGEEVRAIPPR